MQKGAAFIFVFYAALVLGNRTIDIRQVEKLIKRWAPLIWLAPGEKFLPLSVEDYFLHVQLTDENGNRISEKQKASPSHYLRTTKSISELLTSATSFLYGRKPEQVPAYALVKYCHDKKSNKLHFYVTFWLFFPYNEGKEICFLGKVPDIFDTCLGHKELIGNHVGDWERVTLAFDGSDFPKYIYVSTHNIGAYYEYDQNRKMFTYKSQRKPKKIWSKFPPTIKLIENHPVLFAAMGSHGLWTSSGAHTYFSIPKLEDRTGYGIAWKIWDMLEVYHIGITRLPAWLSFPGKWGNPKSSCFLWKKFGLCRFSDGPAGPLFHSPDFVCNV